MCRPSSRPGSGSSTPATTATDAVDADSIATVAVCTPALPVVTPDGELMFAAEVRSVERPGSGVVPRPDEIRVEYAAGTRWGDFPDEWGEAEGHPGSEQRERWIARNAESTCMPVASTS
jgi:hypothetical protein